jgi:hypothetical protein
MKRLNYNMNAAINFRGKTFDEVNMYDPMYMEPNIEFGVISFKQSIEITSGDYDWGNIPDCYYAIMHRNLEKHRNAITKAEWKKYWLDYRIYINHSCERPYYYA